MKRKDLVKKLKSVGYREERNEGGHAIYSKEGRRHIPVPNHKEVNEYTAKAILKAAGLN